MDQHNNLISLKLDEGNIDIPFWLLKEKVKKKAPSKRLLTFNANPPPLRLIFCVPLITSIYLH